jgi:hypothetical protein
MRVAQFASLGALAAAAGLATAQPPAPPPSPANPLASPIPMGQPMPPSGPLPPPPGVTPPMGVTPPPGVTPPATGPTMTPPTDTKPPTPLPPPTPVTPPPPRTVAPYGSAVPAAAWSGLQPAHPGGAFSELAQAYNAPLRGPQTWGSVDYLLWWVRPGPVPVPLVNTTIVPEDLAGSIAAGGVTDPLARTIFGDQSVDFGGLSGVRFVVGTWFDNCQETGFEASMFFLPQQSRGLGFIGGTGTNAQPALTVPFNSVGPGPVIGETSATIAGPFAGAAVIGSINERMTTNLWGGDADMLFNLWKGEFWRFDAIGGFKFLDLYETMDFETTVRTAPFGSTDDQFRTTTRFYGGEIGGRVSAQMDRLGFQFAAKVGLGDNEETVDVRGSSIAPTDFGGAPGLGGLFAQSSNIGSTTHGRFSVVPQIITSVSYDVNCHLKFNAGYNFIYWTDVARPGNQIDRNINPNLAPVFGGAAGGVGAPQPTRLAQESDFWAQGLSLGMTVTW